MGDLFGLANFYFHSVSESVGRLLALCFGSIWFPLVCFGFRSLSNNITAG